MCCFSNLPAFQCYLCPLVFYQRDTNKIDYQPAQEKDLSRLFGGFPTLEHIDLPEKTRLRIAVCLGPTVGSGCCLISIVFLVTDLCEWFIWGKWGRLFRIFVAIFQWFALLESWLSILFVDCNTSPKERRLDFPHVECRGVSKRLHPATVRAAPKSGSHIDTELDHTVDGSEIR